MNLDTLARRLQRRPGDWGELENLRRSLAPSSAHTIEWFMRGGVEWIRVRSANDRTLILERQATADDRDRWK